VTTFSSSSASQAAAEGGTKDGQGCGDHDQPYTFGRRPRVAAPFPFTPAQYGHLLALRGRVGDGLLGADDLEASGLALQTAMPRDDVGEMRDAVARAILDIAGVLAS
jgi:hypothetical protein